MIYDLPRHLRSKKHRWRPGEAKYARNKFEIRKRLIIQGTPANKIRPYKHCPYPGCDAIVTRLGCHTKLCHPMDAIDKQKKASNEILLKSYRHWQQTDYSRQLTDLRIDRNICLVRRILNNSTIASLKDLLNGSFIKSYFKDKIQNNKLQTSSACTHLFALSNFFSFIVTSSFAEMYAKNKSLFKVPIGDIQQEARPLTTSTRKWAATYKNGGDVYIETEYHEDQPNIKNVKWKKGSKVDIAIKFNEEKANTLSKVEQKKRKYGIVHRKAKEIMARYKHPGEEVVQEDFILVRNYLIDVILRNAYHAALVANLKSEDFLRAIVTNDLKIVMDVTYHNKINNTNRGAHIIIHEHIYDVLLFYYKRLRPKYDHIKSHYFFISSEGRKFGTAGIAYCAKSSAKARGVAKKITSSLVSKCARTEVGHECREVKSRSLRHSKCASTEVGNESREVKSQSLRHSTATPSKRQDTSNQLTEETREQWNLEKSDHVSPKADTSIMRDSNGEARELENFVNTNTIAGPSTSGETIAKPIQMIKREKNDGCRMNRKIEKTEDAFEIPVAELSSSVDRSGPVYHQKFKCDRKAKFTETDTEILSKVFKDYINSQCKLSNLSITVGLRGASPDILKKFSVSQIGTRIRYIKQKICGNNSH